MKIIIAYLAAIVLANLSIAQFGANAAIFNAFVFIALDLTARDTLHEQWQHTHLKRNMLLLISTGGALSALLNLSALPIALASCVAFMAAGATDTVIYALLHKHSKMIKMNASNVASAAVDSVLFSALAFGFPLVGGIVIGQWAAKVAGGLLWSWILLRGKA